MSTLEERLATCTTNEEMKLVYHEHLAATGQIGLQRGFSDVTVLTTPKIVERVVTQPEDTSQLLRRAVRLPSGTIQLIEAYSVTGLDYLEHALLARQR